jgi:hypothetical protein
MVKQLLYSGFETENFYECPKCSEAITNPLCHDCLGKQISSWLAFYPDLKKKLSPKLKKYIQEVNNEASSTMNCVACNKKKAALCPYCFTEGIFNLFKRVNLNKNVLGEFLVYFNFDQDKQGYIQDAEKEGLY